VSGVILGSDPYFAIETRESSGAFAIVERLRITGNGNVGINTTNPLFKLDVRGDIGALNAGSDGTLGDCIYFGNAGFPATQNGRIRASTSASASANLITIETSTGTIGSYNNSQLELKGDNTVRMSSLAGSGSRTVTASSSGVLSASSDSSLKQEVKEHKVEGLSEILQLKPKAYKWLDDIEIRGEEAAIEIGFFANEVAPIIPSAAPMDNNGLYGFYDRAVIAALVNAVQELKSEIDILKSK
jgi:hypothetical protein